MNAQRVDDHEPSSVQARDLPEAFNRFIGREREIEELAELRAQTRLLTLTGPSGVGKTRLALRLAQRVGAAYDGIVFVDLSTATSPESLVSLVGAAAGIRSRSGVGGLVDALEGRRAMLVLDDCAQLAAACADLVLVLLSRCPMLHILITSTERLGVPGETLWHVPPLSTPLSGATLDGVQASEAVQLLLERIVEINPRFTMDASNADVLGEICRKVDGLPLALELAAGWINALALTEIAQRLDDPLSLLIRGARGAPERHQTLRAMLDRSTELPPGERQLLFRLAVFAGTWDLDAVRIVCSDDDLPATAVLPLLAELVGKSLVQVVSRGDGVVARYRLLSVVRHYALEKLADADELASLSRRHAAYYGSLAAATPQGEPTIEEIELLIREQDNLSAALNWAIAEGDADLGFVIGTRMHAVWYIHGQHDESGLWFGRLLDVPGGSDWDRVMTATWASNHALSKGDSAAALALSERARDLAEKSGSQELRVLSLDSWAMILLDQGGLADAAAILLRERALLQDLQHDWLLACVLFRLAALALEQRDDVRAELLCSEALGVVGVDGNLWIRMRIERVLGRIALSRGDTDGAAARFDVMLRSSRQLGDRQGLAYALIDVARVAQERRQLSTARGWLREALAIVSAGSEPLLMIRVLEAAGGLLASARPEGCLQVVSAAQRLRARLGMAAWPVEAQTTEHTMELAQSRLSTAAAAAALASGDVLTMDRAVQIAQDLLDSVDAAPQPSSVAANDVLTPREHAVAELVGQGLTNRAIARTLVISEGTVRAHVEHILSKLGLRSRTQIGGRLGQDLHSPTLN